MSLLGRAQQFFNRQLLQELAALRKELHAVESRQTEQVRALLEDQRAYFNAMHTQQIERLEQTRSKQLAAIKYVQEQVRRVERRQEAVLRHQYLRGLPMGAPHDLTVERFRAFSQNGEDGLSLAVFKRIGYTQGKFVDIGCGTKGGNARFFAEEFGWSGLLVDARQEAARLSGLFPPGQVVSLSMWMSRENVNDIVRQHGLDGEIDLLSIDVDGVDYWMWEAVTVTSPRLVIIEYNSFFGPHLTVTVPYHPKFNRKQRDVHYYGASLGALVLLGKKKGYRLVAVEPAGVNAYFVRDDLAPDLPGFEAHHVFRRFSDYQDQISKGDFDLTKFTPENDMPLIDVGVESGNEPTIWIPPGAGADERPIDAFARTGTDVRQKRKET